MLRDLGPFGFLIMFLVIGAVALFVWAIRTLSGRRSDLPKSRGPFCIKCGSTLSAETVFCGSCGHRR